MGKPTYGGRLRRAWLSATLLAAMAASSLLQFGLGVLAPFITTEFGLTRTHYGAAVSTLFFSAVLVSLQAGRFVGRWSEVRLLRTLFILALAALTITAVSPAWGWVMVAAAIMGLPLGLGNPVTNQIIATRVQYGAQGTVVGVKQSGVQLGALFAGLVAAPVAVAFGWRTALVVLAAVPMTGFLLSLPLSEMAGRRRAERVADGGDGGRSALELYLCAYAVLMGFGAAAVNAFLPLFAFEELAIPVGRAGLLVAVIGTIGAVARVAMGMIGNRVQRFDWWLAALATLATGAAVVLLLTTRETTLVWAVAVVFGVSANAWQVAAMLAVVRQVRGTARSSGIVMGGFIGGMMLGPLAFGAIVDTASTHQAGWILVAGAFAAAAMLSVGVAVRVSRTSAPIA